MKTKSFFFASLALALLTSCTINGHAILGDYHYEEFSTYAEYKEPVGLSYGDSPLTLDIDWVSGEIIIKQGDVLRLEETQISSGKEYLPLYYRYSSNTLKIEYCASGTSSELISNNKKKLELIVPSSLIVLTIDSVFASFDVALASLYQMSIDTVSGDGNIKLNTLDYLDFNSVSGNLDLRLSDSSSLEGMNIDSVSGNVNLYLDGKRDYNVKFDTVSGKLTKEFEKGSDESLAPFSIDMDSVSGNLSIKLL